MKKLLVAAIAAALTLGGMSAPANATLNSRPTIPANAAVGDVITAVAGSYTSETLSNRLWFFCNTLQTVATMENSTLRNGLVSAGSCDAMMLAYPGSIHNSLNLTVPRSAWGNNSGQRKLLEGKYLYMLEVTSGSAIYSTAGMLVAAPPLVMPALTGGTSGMIAVGDPLNFTAGSGIPVLGPLSNSLTVACSFDLAPVTPTTNAYTVETTTYPNGNDCVRVQLTPQQNVISWPWNVGSVYDGWSSQVANIATGWYIYRVEYYSDGVYFSDWYWSPPLQVGVAAQTVTYNANTGSGVTANSVANGARNVADGSGFSNPGFTFAGWNTAANGSGTAVAGGASYTPSGNVTLYAQWNRIPTPPAPAFTSPISVAPVGGVLNLTGANMAAVTSITVDDMPATVSTSSSGSVTVKLPTLAPGKYDITIKNADGGIRFIDGLVVPDPNAKVLPKPTTTFVATSAVKVTGTAPSAKQAAAIKTFVAQYKKAKTVTVFIRTSKAGLAAAKKAAAAMLATAVKAIGTKVVSGIVVDSTSEKTTALDLVVAD